MAEWVSENVAVTVIGGVLTLLGVFVAAIFSYLGQKHSRKSVNEVTNTHKTNIRSDIDGLLRDIGLVLTKLDRIDTRAEGHEADIRRLCGQIDRAFESLGGLRKRVENLEWADPEHVKS